MTIDAQPLRAGIPAPAPHILVIPSWYPTAENPVSGVFFRDQVHALRDAGYRVTVAVPKQVSARVLRQRFGTWRSRAEYQLAHGVPTYSWWICVGSGQLPWTARQALLTRNAVTLFRATARMCGMPDVIHAHSALWGGFLGADLKSRFKIPLVITEHSTAFSRGLLSRSELAAAKRAFKAADARLAVSPALGRTLEDLFAEAVIPWRWVPNILDSTFMAQGRPASRADSLSEFHYLNVAMLAEKKGHRDLLHAFAQSFHGQNGVRLRIIGDGPLRSELERLAAELGINGQVDFLGAQDRDRVRTEMLAANAFVLSSHYETFGVVLIEALACGLPVVATSSGGPEFIVNEGNGLLVAPRAIDELAAALVQLRREYARYEADTIRSDALARFGPATILTKLENIYADVRSPADHRVSRAN